MAILEPKQLFEDIADTLVENLIWNPQLTGGLNRERALRYTLRALARFCKLRYEECRIEDRITNLEPPYCSPEQFVATMKECFTWSDEKCEEVFQILKQRF
jgi:hypothetical protein